MTKVKDLAVKVSSPEWHYVKKQIREQGQQKDKKCRLVRGTFVVNNIVK